MSRAQQERHVAYRDARQQRQRLWRDFENLFAFELGQADIIFAQEPILRAVFLNR